VPIQHPIKDYLLKVAPLLGTAIVGPAGGVITTLISQLFGADTTKPDDLWQKISADKESALKLKKLETDHQEFLVSNLVSQYKIHTDDLANARDRQLKMAKMGSKEIIMPILSIIAMMQFWTYILFCKYYNLSVDVTILTDLFAMAFMAFTFYFGSSPGERSLWTSSNSRGP
jgi:hypothetical protein